MVLTGLDINMKKTVIIALLLILFNAFMSCKDGLDEIDCSECLSYKPLDAELYIDVTLNSTYQEVPVIVFRGKFEKGDTVVVDTIYDPRGYINVPLNEYYSVMAIYKSGNTITYAIDGDEFNRHKIEGQCDGTCWIIRGGLYNVELKY